MKKNRCIALLFVLVLAFSLSGCETATEGEKAAVSFLESHIPVMAGVSSEDSLIDTLSNEGFSDQEINYALEEMNIDFEQSAINFANSLIETGLGMTPERILAELEANKFTQEQIDLAMSEIELDENEQALAMVQNLIEYVGTDVDFQFELEMAGFSQEAIDYALANI